MTSIGTGSATSTDPAVAIALEGAMSRRPAFHLTPRRNWMNDPNGLVYVEGVWHAFFQHNPDGIHWGDMSWGHASSRDLASWVEHPVALRHGDGEQIYSGSIVVTDDASLTAVYTSSYDTGIQAQSVAVSRDGGTTWVRDAANPVLDRGSHDFRDPKVLRVQTAEGGQWLMLAVEAVERRVLFYVSEDLRSWRETGSFGPIGPEGVVWECPDLVQVPVEGQPGTRRWVLLLSTNPVGVDADPAGSAMHYVVGAFDGSGFVADAMELVRLDHGRDFYAGVTFHGAPGGEPVMLGWMNNWRYAHDVPSRPWRGAMSLPRRLSLRVDAGRPRLVQHPVGVVGARLQDAPWERIEGPLVLEPRTVVELRWDAAESGPLTVTLRGSDDDLVEIDHDPLDAVMRVRRDGPSARLLHPDFAGQTTAPLRPGAAGRLLISLDGPLLEVFADDGEAVVSNLVTVSTDAVTLVVGARRVSATTAVAIRLAAMGDRSPG